MLFVTVAPVNRDPLLMHVRKFLSCFALWVLRLQGYSQLHLYSIFEQLFYLPLIFVRAIMRSFDASIVASP